jgi:pimeloyl-ACP methyl ester carboxylesterase
MNSNKVSYKTVKVDGINIFYREAGDTSKPSILLLGGFPSSSISFRNLIEELKNVYHLVAPDYPGFGNSDAPSPAEYAYTFDQLAGTIEKFINQIGLKRFSLYAFDYGGPIGFRIAARRPELIQSLIIQNANAYMEGIGEGFGAAMPFLENRNEETEKPIRFLMTLEGIKVFYFTGAENPELISPDAYLADLQNLSKPGLVDIHLNLLHNYSSNVVQFPVWQNYFRIHLPKTLLVWGKNDPFFPEAAARAFLKDLPHAELHLYHTSHFALEEYHHEISIHIKSFLNQLNIK